MEEKGTKKGTSTVAIIVAVVLSIILVPLLMLFGIVGASTTALSNVLQENREEELFAVFERAGGIQWIYDEIGTQMALMEQELEFPKEMEPLKGAVTYEDVSAVSHGVYNALLNLKLYLFDLSVQKERIRANLDAYFDRYIEEQLLTGLVDRETLDKELAKEEYLREPYARLEEEIARLEGNLNAAMEELYQTELLKEAAGIKEKYGVDAIPLALLRESMRRIGRNGIIAMMVLVVLLLVSYLFRPAGFFVAGITAVSLGGVVYVASRGFSHTFFKSVLPAAQIPHESVHAAARQVVSWLSDGLGRFSVYSAAAGGILLIFGVILLLLRKNRA